MCHIVILPSISVNEHMRSVKVAKARPVPEPFQRQPFCAPCMNNNRTCRCFMRCKINRSQFCTTQGIHTVVASTLASLSRSVAPAMQQVTCIPFNLTPSHITFGTTSTSKPYTSSAQPGGTTHTCTRHSHQAYPAYACRDSPVGMPFQQVHIELHGECFCLLWRGTGECEIKSWKVLTAQDIHVSSTTSALHEQRRAHQETSALGWRGADVPTCRLNLRMRQSILHICIPMRLQLVPPVHAFPCPLFVRLALWASPSHGRCTLVLYELESSCRFHGLHDNATL